MGIELLKLILFGSSLSSCCFPLTTWNENMHVGALMCFLHVCLCAHVCLCVHVGVCVCTCVFVCVCIYIYISVCVICASVNVSECPHVCMSARMYACMNAIRTASIQICRRRTGWPTRGRHGISAFSQFLWLSDSKELFQNSPQRDFGNQGKSQKQKLELWDSQPWSASIQSVSSETLNLRCTFPLDISES